MSRRPARTTWSSASRTEAVRSRPDAISLRDAAGNVLAKVSVPDTGGWANYQSIHAQVTLPAGDQLVTLFCETGGFNVDYLKLG